MKFSQFTSYYLLFRLNFFLSTLFSNILIMRDQVLHPYKKGKNNVLYVLNFSRQRNSIKLHQAVQINYHSRDRLISSVRNIMMGTESVSETSVICNT